MLVASSCTKLFVCMARTLPKCARLSSITKNRSSLPITNQRALEFQNEKVTRCRIIRICDDILSLPLGLTMKRRAFLTAATTTILPRACRHLSGA